MDFNGFNVGFALTGSFCTFANVMTQVEVIKNLGANLLPIMSETAASTDTRFGSSEFFKSRLEEITGKKAICTIKEAEPIGPKKLLDILVIAPCTGNTMSKLSYGITDSSVTMAAKSHIRNGRPVIIAIATNDALGNSAKNIGHLLNTKHIYFVPFRQDDPVNKQNSMISDMTLLPQAIQYALGGMQMQPIILGSDY